ncbi:MULTISPECIES: hypothetical protein [unclassified Nocardiopsis]|uniref:hypothetical protein n=1 Tax=Nocardiopsis TaxID=2013 RepID=UPI00387B4868
MSTSENTTPSDDTAPDGPTADDAPAADTPETKAPATATAAAPDTAAARPADAFLDAGRAASTPGVLSAETFALASLLLLAPAATGQRLFELFGRFAFTDVTLETEGHLASVNADLLAYGGLGVLTVLTASLSLVLSREATRPWARWVSSATVLAGGLFVVLAIVTYVIAAGRI